MKITFAQDSGARIAGLQRAGCVICAVAALAFSSIFIQAKTSALASSTNQPNPIMKQFVLLFRQSPIQLTEADQKRRAEEVRAWALLQALPKFKEYAP